MGNYFFVTEQKSMAVPIPNCDHSGDKWMGKPASHNQREFTWMKKNQMSFRILFNLARHIGTQKITKYENKFGKPYK